MSTSPGLGDRSPNTYVCVWYKIGRLTTDTRFCGNACRSVDRVVLRVNGRASVRTYTTASDDSTREALATCPSAISDIQSDYRIVTASGHHCGLGETHLQAASLSAIDLNGN